MNEKQFKKEITSIVTGARKQLMELREKESALKASRKDFSPQYVRERLEPEIDEVRMKMNTVRTVAQSDAAKIVEEYAAQLRKADVLNPADLNDDVRLLNCGVSLTERDLKDMLARNSGNRTMTQLIMRYAGERKINTEMQYVSAETATSELQRAVPAVIKTVLNHPESDYAFNQLFGPGTSFYTE